MSPCAGAMTASNARRAEVQDKPSAPHRAKGRALGTVPMQIMVFAAEGTLLPHTWDTGEEGWRGCCSSSGLAGGKGLGCPVPQAEEDVSVRKSLWAFRSNRWTISGNGKTAMKISSVMLMDTFLKVHLRKLRNVIPGASIASNEFETPTLVQRSSPGRGQQTIPCPCSKEGTRAALPNSHTDRTILTCGWRLLHEPANQLGFRMSHPEHPATMTAETCSCDRKGHRNWISHSN